MIQPDDPVAGWKDIDGPRSSNYENTQDLVLGFKPLDDSRNFDSGPVVQNPDSPVVGWHSFEDHQRSGSEMSEQVESSFLTEDANLLMGEDEDEDENTDSMETQESMESVEHSVATAIVNANREFIAFKTIVSRHASELHLTGYVSGTHAEVDVRAVDFIRNKYPQEFEAKLRSMAERNTSFYGPNDLGIRLIRDEDDRVVTLRAWSFSPQNLHAFPLVRRALGLTRIDAASLPISFDMPAFPKADEEGFSAPTTDMMRSVTRSGIEIWLGKTPAGTSIRVDVDRYGKGKTATHMVRAITFIRESMH